MTTSAFGARRFVVVLAIVVGVTGLLSGFPAADAATPEDEAAVRQVILDLVAAFNSEEFQQASFKERGEMVRHLYHFETDKPREERTMYFGPLTHPVARGAAEHLANVNTNFEWFLSQGYGYGLRIDEMQTLVDDNLAVVFVVSRNWFTSPNGVAFAPQLGRGMIALVKDSETEAWEITGVEGSMEEVDDQTQLFGLESIAPLLDSCSECPTEARWIGLTPKAVAHQRPEIESLETLVERIQSVNPWFDPPAGLSELLAARQEIRDTAIGILSGTAQGK